MITFYKLKDVMNRKGMKGYHLAEKCGFSTSTVTNLMHNGVTTTNVIDRVCKALDCQPADIMEYVPDK